MRVIIITIILFLLTPVYSQDLFELVKKEDHHGVRNFNGAVNLRDTNQATPLMWAVYRSDLKMVKTLEKKGADVTLKGWILFKDPVSKLDFIYGSCLAIAAGEGKMNQLKYFIRKHDIPPDDREVMLNDFEENGWTALHWASVKGNKRAVKYLVRHHADINAISENDFNQSPLLFAINFNQIETAKLLIRLGADVNQQDRFGVVPLTCALEIQDRDLVKCLVKHGAKLEEYAERPLEDMLLDLFGVKQIEDL